MFPVGGLVLALAFLGVASAAASSLPVIGSDGVCKPLAQISSFLSESKVGSRAGCQTLGIVDLSGAGCKLANSLFKTAFPDSHLGICLDATDSGAVLIAQYESMYSSNYCGSKAADFLGSFSNTLLVMLPPAEAVEIMTAHDQTLRRLAQAIKSRLHSAKPVRALFFLTDGLDSRAVEDVAQAFEGVWADVCEEDKLGDCVEIKAYAVDANDAERLAAFKASLSKALESTPSEDTPVVSLAEKLAETWGPIASATPRPIFTLAQRQSIFLIESAFTVGVAHSEAAFSQWQARVGQGKVVGKFGARVQELLDSVHGRFMDQTKGTVSVRERSQRARQLRDNIESVASTLFKQQLAILQAQTSSRFRKMLISLARSAERESDAVREDEQQALRKTLFDFRALALDLEVESLGLSSTSFQAEVSSALQTLLTEFPESSFGRLEAVKRLERETKRPKKRKGGAGNKGKGRAINIGLNLVGMLRPPGTGNLQGFAGYSTALLGLPLELLLGVQNDGDSPEIMGEDREYPLLRLQPKLSFDIDI